MNPLPPLPLIDGCLFVDNSGFVEGMSTCYRYLQYKSLNLRIPTGEKPSLNFGSAIHTGMELRYVHYGASLVDELRYFEDVSALLSNFFTEHPPANDDWRSLNWSMQLLRRYLEKYPTEDFSLLNYDKPIGCPHCNGLGFVPFEKMAKRCIWCSATGKRRSMVELSFALPLFTWEGFLPAEAGHITYSPDKSRIPVIYTGRIDLPVSIDGKIYVMDHKTTSMLGDWFWNDQRMSAQQRGYAWAFSELTGKPITGFIVNGIRTKEPPLYVTNGGISKTGKRQSPTEWWNESFARERFLLHPGELTEWKSNTIDLCEEFFWHYSRGYMPMKTKWCTSYGKCPYYDVCRLPSSDRDFMLASGEFTDNTWSPLKQPTQAKV